MSAKRKLKPTPADLEIAETTEAPADLEAAETTEAPTNLESTETTEAPADLKTTKTTQPSAELETDETTQPSAELETDETTQPSADLKAIEKPEAPAELEIAETTEAPTDSETAETTEAPAKVETAETREPEPEPEHNGAFFQAVGILPGEVSFEEGSIMSKVTVGGKEYPLLFKPRLMSAMVALKLEIKQSGVSTQRLIVYPKVMHFPKPDQPHQLAFQLVGFEKDSANSAISMQLEDFEFKLSGLWQFIPVCRVPVISVFRNFDETIHQNLKKLDEAVAAKKKVNFMKAAHIPLIWKDSPFKPFRFNPKLEKEEQGRPLFLQLKAKFIPAKDGFEFVALLAPPLEKAPKFFKASNDDKATVQKQKKKNAKPSKSKTTPSKAKATPSKSKSKQDKPPQPKPKPRPVKAQQESGE
jgi:chemotaxis protein histidine kinase CheA